MSGKPLLGQPVEVKAIFALNEFIKNVAANTTAEIILPKEFEIVSGNLTWQGDMLPGHKYDISAVIKAVKTGDNLKIEARAFQYLGPQSSRSGIAVLYAHVFQDRATLSETLTGPEAVGTGKPTTPPPGWKPPPGYEDEIPISPGPPPEKEPPIQNVPPVKAPY